MAGTWWREGGRQHPLSIWPLSWDILIYSNIWAEHLDQIRQVFCLLKQHRFKVKLYKCSFAQPELYYLGHIISAQGVATDPGKAAIVQNWPTPSAKEVRSFFGLAGYYKCVQIFGTISKPLRNLVRKGVLFVWTAAEEASFRALKSALTTAPVLALPDLHKPLSLRQMPLTKELVQFFSKRVTP